MPFIVGSFLGAETEANLGQTFSFEAGLVFSVLAWVSILLAVVCAALLLLLGSAARDLRFLCDNLHLLEVSGLT